MMYEVGSALGADWASKDAPIYNLRLYSLEFVRAWRMALMLPSFGTGEHGALDEVLTLRGKEFEISTRRSRSVNADGEIVTQTSNLPGTAKAIEVIVPDQGA